MMEGEKLVRHPNGAPVSFPKTLARLSDREIARRTELDDRFSCGIGERSDLNRGLN
jgi:hypothetical protein